MSYEMIVKHCAPTLAGLKIGNLFSYAYEDDNTLENQLIHNNKLLNKKGIYFRILRRKNGVALIYVYRINKLQALLNSSDIQAFLASKEYTSYDLESCLNLLELHLQNCDFPHEIGLFLGYPMEDVKAFIKNKGNNYKHVGYWKVYSDLNEALRTFEKFKKCTSIYCQRYEAGYDISRLTVVG